MRLARLLVLLALPVLLAAGGGSGAGYPRAGLVVETTRGVLLVDLQGHVRRSLAGFHFYPQGSALLELQDRGGRVWALRRGSLVRPAPAAPARGFTLTWSKAGAALLRDGRVVERFPADAEVWLDASRTILTVMYLAHGGEVGRAVGPTIVRNLRTGSWRAAPRGCRPVLEARGVEFQLCGYPYVEEQPSTIVRVDANGRRRTTLTAIWPDLGPGRTKHRPNGSWQFVLLSPDGRTLLSQSSGDCEVPTAWLVDTTTGRRTLIGVLDKLGELPESWALGWVADEAFASLPTAGCSTNPRQPGVYALRPDGHARLVYPLPRTATYVALWQR